MLESKSLFEAALRFLQICSVNQGCRIFLGTIYQNEETYTKLPQNIPNGHKITSNGRKIDQICIKYTNILHCKTLQILPKLQFLVWKYSIWQPWCERRDDLTFESTKCMTRRKGLRTRTANVTEVYFSQKKKHFWTSSLTLALTLSFRERARKERWA
jgi:hypothetical protein